MQKSGYVDLKHNQKQGTVCTSMSGRCTRPELATAVQADGEICIR